jgi:hypothetical protein
MRVERAINDYLDGLASARIALHSPTVLVPFAAFGGFQCVVLAALAFFTAPPLAPLLVPVVVALGGEASLHYPTHFVFLPETYRTAYLPLVATVGFALWSWGAWSMIDRHEAARKLPARRFRTALPAIVLLGIVFVATTVGIGRVVGLAAQRAPEGLPARGLLLVSIALTACVQALLLYAPVVLRLRGGGPLAAIRTGARYALRHFAATVLLVGTVLFVHAPLDALLANADRVALRFHPEAVFYVMLLSIALEVLTAFILFAGLVGLALPEEGGLA